MWIRMIKLSYLLGPRFLGVGFLGVAFGLPIFRFTFRTAFFSPTLWGGHFFDFRGVVFVLGPLLLSEAEATRRRGGSSRAGSASRLTSTFCPGGGCS
jgi:hypothetical protein